MEADKSRRNKKPKYKIKIKNAGENHPHFLFMHKASFLDEYYLFFALK